MRPVSAHDCLVVGAGPAGAWAARQLASQGVDVLLLQRRDPATPDDEPLLLSPAARRLLPPLDASLVAAELTRLRLLDGGAELAEVELDRRDAFAVVRRDSLLRRMLEEAGRAGARLRTGCEAEGFELDTSAVLLDTSVGRFRASAVVVAEGPAGTVGRAVPRRDARVPLLVTRWHGTPAGSSASPALEVDVGAVDGGLAWSYEAGDEVVAGAWGSLDGDAARRLLGTMAERHDAGRAGAESTGTLPVFDAEEPLHAGPLVFVGAAAGLVDPLTGEGMRWALESAALVARAVAAHLRRNAPLDAYTEAVRASCYADLAFAKRLARWCDLAPAMAWRSLARMPAARERITDLLAGRLTYRQYLATAARTPALRLLRAASWLRPTSRW